VELTSEPAVAQDCGMAKETFERLIDDLDGSPATQTVKFGVDGRQYHIDLNDDHANELRTKLAVYVARAERVRSNRPGRTIPNIGKERNQAIRDWARSAGVELPSRGRISGRVQAAFDAQDIAALYHALGLEPPAAKTIRGRKRTPAATFSAGE
jgi:nucleoid-associated protein Lsr2